MIPTDFEYHRADSVEDAIQLLNKFGDEVTPEHTRKNNRYHPH